MNLSYRYLLGIISGGCKGLNLSFVEEFLVFMIVIFLGLNISFLFVKFIMLFSYYF